jgi:hypothetical protein
VCEGEGHAASRQVAPSLALSGRPGHFVFAWGNDQNDSPAGEKGKKITRLPAERKAWESSVDYCFKVFDDINLVCKKVWGEYGDVAQSLFAFGSGRVYSALISTTGE